MKDISKQRLIYLATAQESIFDLTKYIEQWERTQSVLEKNAFDTMNINDKILKLSKEGSKLVERLQENVLAGAKASREEDIKTVAALLQELEETLKRIEEHTCCTNETVHILENEVVKQQEIGEAMKSQVCKVTDNIDSAVACEEFLFTEC